MGCLERESEAIAQALLNDDGREFDSQASTDRSQVSQIITERVKISLSERILPVFLSWLYEKEFNTAPALNSETRTDLNRSLEDCLVLPPLSVLKGERRAPLGLALAAGFGALLGNLCAGLLYPEGLGYRETALLLGGTIGATTLILLFASLPPARLGPLAEAGAPREGRLRLLWNWLGIRSKRTSQTGHAAAELARQIRAMLQHGADLLLALGWAQVFQQEIARESVQAKAIEEGGPSVGEEQEPISVYEAIGAFSWALRRHQVDPQELRDIAEELLQRFQDEGFEWKVVEDGAPYQATIKHDFDTFGHLEPGQPVTTVHAALRRHGVLKQRGLLRRFRPLEEVKS